MDYRLSGLTGRSSVTQNVQEITIGVCTGTYSARAKGLGRADLFRRFRGDGAAGSVAGQEVRDAGSGGPGDKNVGARAKSPAAPGGAEPPDHKECLMPLAIEAPNQCPRCKGIMLGESDAHGLYSSCLACGHVHETLMISPAELEEEQTVEDGRQRRRQPSHGKLRL